jgi:ribonuclease P protein component
MIVRPLKGFDAFAAALRTGSRVTVGPLVLTYIVGQPSDVVTTLYLGVGVSKRTAPHAVVRTRIRRLLREAVRSSVSSRHRHITEARISIMVVTWRKAPLHPSQIGLRDIEPVVAEALDRVLRLAGQGADQ